MVGTSKMSKRIVHETVAMVWKLKLRNLLRKLFRVRDKSKNAAYGEIFRTLFYLID